MCKGKSKEPILNIHHVIHKGDGGKDHQDNLLTTCIKCHKDYHKGKKKITKAHLKNLGKLVRTLDATQVSTITKRLQRFLKTTDLSIVKTYGYLTKKKRKRVHLRKSHKADAFAISCPLKVRMDKPRLHVFYRKKCCSKGQYKLTKGIHSQQKLNEGKLFGFKCQDKVLYRGNEYLISGRMRSGYLILASSKFEGVKLRPMATPETVTRLGARTSCVTFQVQNQA